MSNDPQPRKTQADADLEREVRAERKFTLTEAIGRMAGPGAMKGASPVTRKREAEAELQEYLARHLDDSGGVLRGLVLRLVTESDLMLEHLDQPLAALAGGVGRALGSDYLLTELVREADAEWGRVTGEQPHFNVAGQPPHPDDPYTPDSIRAALQRLADSLAGEKGVK